MAKRKRPKSYYRKCSSKKGRSESKLDAGMKGLLITCNRDEPRCVREAYNILSSYADKLYGSETKRESDSDGLSDEDIAESLEKEVEAMQKTNKEKKFRFQSVDSRAKNVVFIKTNIPDDPVNLVHHMLEDIQVKGQSVSQHILRIHPASITCRANVEQIEKAALEIITPIFHGSEANDSSYAIIYKARNNREIVKTEVISVIGTAVKSDKTHTHKVDLDDPDYTIIVEVICNVCCLGIVRDYNKFKRYNLNELVKEDGVQDRNSKTESFRQNRNNCESTNKEAVVKEPIFKKNDTSALSEKNCVETETVDICEKEGATLSDGKGDDDIADVKEGYFVGSKSDSQKEKNENVNDRTSGDTETTCSKPIKEDAEADSKDVNELGDSKGVPAGEEEGFKLFSS